MAQRRKTKKRSLIRDAGSDMGYQTYGSMNAKKSPSQALGNQPITTLVSEDTGSSQRKFELLSSSALLMTDQTATLVGFY